MPLPSPKVAFVAGCNGITGNAIVEHLIRQPKEQWSHIVVTSRSSLKNYWQDPRVEFVAIDFLEPVETIIAKCWKPEYRVLANSVNRVNERVSVLAQMVLPVRCLYRYEHTK